VTEPPVVVKTGGAAAQCSRRLAELFRQACRCRPANTQHTGVKKITGQWGAQASFAASSVFFKFSLAL
jgi:hypothetical protein